LELILSSDQLSLENEDQLFNLIANLIKLNESKKVLLKYIHFKYVSSNLMISFFQDFHFELIDIDLFESLKQRLFVMLFFESLVNINIPSLH
jgi:hypothetical protein